MLRFAKMAASPGIPGQQKTPTRGNKGARVKITWKTVAPLVVWLVLYLVPVPAGLNADQWHYFAIFSAVIAGLILESMPVGAVGLIGLTVAGVMGYVEHDPNKSLRWMLGGFAESTVWLIVGAFVFSIGYRKSGLGKRIALLLVRGLGRRTIGLGYAVAFADLILAPATPSNTARSGGTIYPIISNIPQIYGSEPGPTAGRLLLGEFQRQRATALAFSGSQFCAQELEIRSEYAGLPKWKGALFRRPGQ